jgi:hypothetical protein
MFIALLFKITKLWKQPRCPTTNEWIKKMWYLYTMEFYSAMKNEIFFKMVENIILSEDSQPQKTKNRVFFTYADFRSRSNAAMLLALGHTLRGEHLREEWG